MICPTCGGKGVVRIHRCPKCKGTGVIKWVREVIKSGSPCVVIPAHNEADNIGQVIDQVKALGIVSVVVVDDDSNDATIDVAREHGADVYRNGPGAEYGDGFLTGLLVATHYTADPIIFLDAGLSYQPKDIDKLLSVKADVVIGSRIIKGATYNGSRYRKLLTHVAIWTFAIVRRKKIMDYSGFRLFRLSATRALPWKSLYKADKKAHTFNLRVVALLQDSHLNITQVPVNYVVTNSTLNWRRTLSAACELFHIWRQQ